MKQCCSLFYQIINNSSYIKQSNNFKTLCLTPQRLDRQLETEYNFCKYCLPETVIVCCGDLQTKNNLKVLVGQIEEKMKRARAVDRCDKWITSVLKSTKSLKFTADTSILLHTLPIDILFDSDESKLETIESDYYWKEYGKETWNKCVNKFKAQYLDLEKRLKIKVKKCVY